MDQASHKLVTQKAFDILRSLNNSLQLLGSDTIVAQEAYNTDEYTDMEFVNVEGGIGDGGRDNPHSNDTFAVDDNAHYSEKGRPLTTYNHFIDIKKGEGRFDDFDGYSYEYGSAHIDQFQDASDAAGGFWEEVAADILGKKVDAALSWWFNDEYIHAPAHSWYDKCSLAIERYSFPADKGIYGTVNDELNARFPLADSTGQDGKGIPYSVFMPVDNLARYWYTEFSKTKKPTNLGPVMHAIQDASILHHAAGYSGNWHDRYEPELGTHVQTWLNDAGFINEVKELFMQWYKYDNTCPAHLAQNDWSKKPARNWRIDNLVTWVALNAYRDYAGVYNHFRGGYSFHADSARNLTKLATAMCLLVLANASGYEIPKKVPIIYCPETFHDFMSLEPGQSADYTFTVISKGQLPLNIMSIKPPATPEFTIQKIVPQVPASLNPSGTLSVTVRFTMPKSLKTPPVLHKPFGSNPPKPDKLVGNILLEKPKSYSDSITIISNADNQPSLTISFHGGNPKGKDWQHMVDMERESLRSKLNWPVLTREEIEHISIRINEYEKLRQSSIKG